MLVNLVHLRSTQSCKFGLIMKNHIYCNASWTIRAQDIIKARKLNNILRCYLFLQMHEKCPTLANERLSLIFFALEVLMSDCTNVLDEMICAQGNLQKK
jgi:hypothetical protein